MTFPPCRNCGIPACMPDRYCIGCSELALGKNPNWWKAEPRHPSFRRTDPATSRQAAVVMPKVWNTHAARLLAAYASTEAVNGLTDEEACIMCHLERGGWKRCSDLRRAGLIRPTMLTRQASSGLEQQVCEITKAGLAQHKANQAGRK